ncbi:pectin esterase [Salegentibacter salinarum]|uniref:Pectinesterase n=1 Tax=Salegentibacter salinarum TaxID=447422 RepID=A0A2N0TNY1_9FLAO|nr:pectinesterase family protein [Salegentibacter salinarum]PKD16443.1 pectin esterase [Salegentibacter salinarum]SKB64376.1 pectinesterase [Salegentibacter salinarum]
MNVKKLIFIPLFFLISNLSAQSTEEVYWSITVDKSGTGDFTKIQQAINSTRDLGPGFVEIHIKNGMYNEKLKIPSWKHKLRLIGEDRDKTIIANNDFSGKKDSINGKTLSTFTSYTLLVSGDEIEIENLTVKNNSCGEGQAVALHVQGDKFISENVNILGCQDTIYAATGSSRQYYKNCYIEGTTDFIFGQATALFEECTIKSLRNSYITAAATTQNQDFGFVFLDCKLIADDDVNEVYLGRPWRPFAKTVFINSEFGEHILPEGWDPWHGDEMFPDKQKTTFYAEYNNSGPGADISHRIKWSKQLTKAEVKKYTTEKIFKSEDSWNPAE